MQNRPLTEQYKQHYSQADDEIDLRELFAVIWQGKWIIIAITALFAVATVIYVVNQPDIYKAEALLTPSSEGEGGGLASMAGQLGGIASLAGINLGGSSGPDNTALAMEILKSRYFVGEFIDKHDLLVALMAAEGWDRTTNQLKINVDLYDPSTQTWIRNVSPPKHAEPSLLEAHKRFVNESLEISQSKDSGLVTVSISHYSPEVAAQWVSWLVSDINLFMKHRDLRETRNNIAYLEEQLNKTSVSAMQTVFYQLIEEQTKKLMLAEVQDEYVFKTVDPAVVPEEKAKPRRALLCILGTMLGGMLGVILVLVRYFLHK